MSTDDPEEDPFTIAADAWVVRNPNDEPDDERLAIKDMDHDAQEIEARHAAELDRIIAPPIKASDPAFEKLASDRRADVYAHHQQLQAVGPDEGFIEPESAETHVAAPKGASGFAVEHLKCRRPK
jgi:hypothetical protein